MNKRIMTLALALFAFALNIAAQDTLRVLAIGNSFSQDSVEQNLHEIASEDGNVFIIGNMYIGGCPLERHWHNSLTDNRDYEYRKIGVDGVKHNHKGTTLDEALNDEEWDIVTLQQSSGKSGKPQSFEPYLEELVIYVRARAPKAKIMWHQTWAYANHAAHNDFPYYHRDQTVMYEEIVAAGKYVISRYGFDIIPSGTAVQNLRATVDGDNCTRDGYHLSHTIGRYTAALTWYEAITGRSTAAIRYRPKGLSAYRANLARKCAHAAVFQPFEVTDLGLSEAPTADVEAPGSLLTDNDGRRISSVKAWNRHRSELLEECTNTHFGTAPLRGELACQTIAEDKDALGGRATRKEVRVFYNARKDRYFKLLLYTPNSIEHAPVFLGINAKGNETVCGDVSITRPNRAELGRYGIHDICSRGEAADAWQVDMLIDNGFGFATFCADDVAPDCDNSGVLGVRPHYADSLTWGTYSQLAWALGKAMDYLSTEPAVDASKVTLVGQDYLATPTLWAAATDQRFDGVALLNLESSRLVVPAAEQYRYNSRVSMCPGGCASCPSADLVQPCREAELFALVAPRPIYVTADDAVWIGLNADSASEVYKLWGRKMKNGIKISATGNDLTAETVWSELIESFR